MSSQEWIEVTGGINEDRLRDPDVVWAALRQKLAERRFQAVERNPPPERSLAEMRQSCSVSQERLALRLGMKQSHVSRLERRADPRLSVLKSYVESLGGSLELRIRLPKRTVRLRLT